MPKPNKSSASAGTRKKHAKKSGKPEDEAAGPSRPKQRGEKKLSKAQRKALPKVKQYIPPPKPPTPPIPDPLDGQGLARTLPAELVVVLRRLGKKDGVTRRKGLEELKEGWVAEVMRQGQDDGEDGDEQAVEREIKESALVDAVPVWMHNLASLLQSPFHRSLALQLHTDLLSIPSLRTAILDTLSLSLLPGTQNRDVLGSWLVAVLEEGRRAGGAALRSWNESTLWSALSADGSGAEAESKDGKIDLTLQISTLAEYLSLSILDSPSLHDDIHPSPVSSAPPSSKAPMKGPAKVQKGRVTPASSSTPPTPAAAEDDELAEERWARYRVGGLVGLSWLLQQLRAQGRDTLPSEVRALLANPHLWTALSPRSTSEEVTLGGGQPTVRRAAYSLLATLADVYPEMLSEDGVLPMLAEAVLGSCWKETEASVWETAGPAVVKFLSKNRSAWELVSAGQSGREQVEDVQGDEGKEGSGDEDGDDHQSDDGSDSGDEDDAPAVPEPPSTDLTAHTVLPIAYTDLLHFVSATCPLIPHLTYPLLLVIISTLPPSLLPLSSPPYPALQQLFAHLWSALDARLLATHALPGQTSAFQAYLRDVGDCIMFLIGRASRLDNGQGQATARWLAEEQLGKMWDEGVLAMGGKAGRRGGKETAQAREVEAGAFGQALNKLADRDGGSELVQVVLAVMRRNLAERSFPTGTDSQKSSTVLPRSLAILAAVREGNATPEVTDGLDGMVGEIAEGCADGLEEATRDKSSDAAVYAEAVVGILEAYPHLVPSTLRDRLNVMLRSVGPDVVDALSPDQIVGLFNALASSGDPSIQATPRQTFWALVDSASIPQERRFAVAQRLLSARQSTLLDTGLLDNIALEAAQASLAGGSASATTVAAFCVTSQGPLSLDALQTILALVSTSLHDRIADLLSHTPDASPPTPALEIFGAYAKLHPQEVVQSEVYARAMISVHHLIAILPRMSQELSGVSVAAEGVWSIVKSLSEGEQETLRDGVYKDLEDMLARVDSGVNPDVLVDVSLITAVGNLTPPTPLDVSKRLLPPVAEMIESLTKHAAQAPQSTLPIIDPLIPLSVSDVASTDRSSDFDILGRSRLGRLLEAVLALLRTDRRLAQSEPALLQLVLSGKALVGDAIAVPGASRGLYAKDISATYLEDFTRGADGALSYALAEVDEVSLDWHKTTVDALKTGTAADGADFLQRLFVALKQAIEGSGSDVPSRVLRDVLSRHLRQSGAGEAEAETWLSFAMSQVDKSPNTATAILLAVKPLLLDAKPLEVAQSRLANTLTGVPASSANSRGLALLRLVLASAPPPDSTSLFLPQNRALFLLRHLTAWLASDESDDFAEELEVRIAEVFRVLAPVVQDVQGGHWESLFDVMENGLEGMDLAEEDSLALGWEALRLLREVRGLCSTNKSLRALWAERKEGQMVQVVRLFLQCRNADSIPIQLIQAALLDLLDDVPDNIMENASLAELCDLLKLATSAAVQSAAYRLLNKVIKQRTMALVLEVEASVSEAEEGHASRTIALPTELVGIVEAGGLIDWQAEATTSVVLGQLLAWMAILDHFDDASRTLRWAYLDQLNSSKLIDNRLLPMLFSMLGVSEVGAWNFPASQYAVDEFYPDLLEPEDLPDLVPLASHLFYRSLVTIPLALRTYYESLKSRQLSLSMLSFVARHYSPVIIAHEFSALREPAAMSQLTEEGLNVRIAQGGGATVGGAGGAAEAIASYVVDEQPMEIGIRLPAEFPLRGVDVRDLRRVGVPENKWRGWLMSVQQTITSRNGLILEALTVFKKNVSLHFEGVVECAICYSIISLTDRTLPTKPCRTCKNRFHASCLFKWFNSSHSSSCPLCRALF